MPAKDRKNQLLILCCSPHTNGSAARAARIIAAGASEKGPAPVIVPLWDKKLAGCIHCDACAKAPHACPLAAKDDCEELFSLILSHEHVLWLSPVYFYGLPSQAKALIDRGQRFYNASPCRGARDAEAVRKTGRSTALFLAGQTRGAKLFEGSRLGVKYFMAALGCPVEKAFALRGVNTPDDITPAIEEALLGLGRILAGRPGRTAPPLEELQPYKSHL